MGRLLAVLVSVAVGSALAASAAAGKHRPLHRVMIFGDSVAAALNWDSTAKNVLARDVRLTVDLAPCRRLTTPGCISPPPPSVLSDVRRLGRRLGPTVVILVGYNDDPHVYAKGIYQVLRAMHQRGVRHVLWLTLTPVYNQYRIINAEIHVASTKFSWMSVLNWGSHSRNHPSWFASDGIHLSGEGAVQLAIYVHRTLQRMKLTGPLPRRQSQPRSG